MFKLRIFLGGLGLQPSPMSLLMLYAKYLIANNLFDSFSKCDAILMQLNHIDVPTDLAEGVCAVVHDGAGVVAGPQVVDLVLVVFQEVVLHTWDRARLSSIFLLDISTDTSLKLKFSKYYFLAAEKNIALLQF